jgi:NPCBM/NEW2 domain/Glycosyl hydrolase family 71
MNIGSVSRAAAACDLVGIRQSWPNRYSVTVMTALFVALTVGMLTSLSGTASADTSNLTSSADTQIAENSPATNYGGATTVKVDGDDPGGSGRDAYSLLRWNLSSVPAGSQVDSASVTVNVTNSSTQTYQIYDLKRPWVESAATWLQYASGSAWEVAGAKGSLDRGSQVGSLSASTTGKRTFTLSPALVQRWLTNPSSNQGIIIANATNTDGVDFSSREAADASLRPTLSMNYTGTTTPPPSPSRYLSDMDWTSSTNGWGPAEKNTSNGEQTSGDGHTITLNGATFQKGLGVHGASDVRYSLAGAYSTFSAKVGVDDEVGDRGSVVFEVWADGTRLYSSGVMNGASGTKDVRLPVRGKNDLRLVVTNASDGSDFDHADWAEAMVDNSSPPPADADGDGVTDDVDNCDNQAGPASNNGCPTVEPPPSGTDPPNVCAHWHVAAQRGVSGIDTPAELQPQFAAAKEAGVECFALNVNGWDSNYQFNTNLVWDAANQWNAAHPEHKVYLYPSIDFASISSEATFEAISRHKYNDPARLRADGGVRGDNLPVTQTWQGQNHFGGPSGWQRVLNEEANAGYPVFFMPMFDPGNAGMTIGQMVDAYNGSNNSSQSDDIVDGFYNFGGLASGTNSERGYQKNQEYDNAIDPSPGMDFQAGCAPHFNRHSDTGQFGNRILGNFAGFHSFKKCMEGFANEQKPRFMEFTTWNDYLEGSYLGVNYSQAQLPSTWDGNYLDHSAFRKISAYYVNWHESGSQPVIDRDLIAIAHRPHFEGATGVNGSTDSIGLPKQVDYSVVEDRLYALVILKQPGDIRLTSGGSTQTFSQPAGVSEVSMPFAAGTQKIELVRNGATQLSAISAIPITLGPVTLFNYNVATTYAEGP